VQATTIDDKLPFCSRRTALNNGGDIQRNVATITKTENQKQVNFIVKFKNQKK
jgi:hypothetical protein